MRPTENQGAPSQPVSIRLGGLTEVYKVQCARKGVSVNDAMRDLVARTVREQPTPQPSLKLQGKSARFRVNLGDLTEDFKQWCQKQGIGQSAALRELIIQELALSLLSAHSDQWPLLDLEYAQTDQSDSNQTNRTTSQVRLGHAEQSQEKARLRLRLKPSELEVLGHLAEQRRVSTQRLVTQVLRAFLLKIASYSDQETVDLGAINLTLMRMVNQLERINELTTDDDLLQDIAQCVIQITSHVKACAQALQLSRERWQIELKG